MHRFVSKKISSGYGRPGPSWHIKNLVKGMDTFANEIPAFNLKGETKVKTLFGGLVTAGILLVVLTYALMKAIHLVDRRNP